MNLSTNYLGLPLKNPIVASSSPLSHNVDSIRRLEDAGAKVLDLHLWRLGPGHHAAIAVIAGADLSPVNHYHARLAGLDGLSHVTIETRGQPTP